jgi:hypothetical protein
MLGFTVVRFKYDVYWLFGGKVLHNGGSKLIGCWALDGPR